MKNTICSQRHPLKNYKGGGTYTCPKCGKTLNLQGYGEGEHRAWAVPTHCIPNPTGTISGRVQTTEPNMAEAPKISTLFAAPKGNTYKGKVVKYEGIVTITLPSGSEQDLPLYLAVANHSPTGFAWGYQGSGPTQLALALCLHALSSNEESNKSNWAPTLDQPTINRAQLVYQEFKRRKIANIDIDSSWEMTQEEIIAEIIDIEAQVSTI